MRGGCSEMPSGTSRLPSRIAFDSVSGVDSNWRRYSSTAASERHSGSAAPLVQLRRDRLEQPDLGQLAERLLRRSRRAGSCSTPRAAAAASSSRSRGDGGGSPASSDGSIVKSSRAASAIARIIRTGSSLQPHVGIADRADDAGAQILEAADVVDDREGGDVVGERVDREVAAERVFFRRAERVVVMDQLLAFGRRRIGRRHAVLHDFLAGRDLAAERRDLDHLLPELDVREAEAPADDPAVPEELLDLIRMRGRADVEILRTAAEQQVADAAADEIGGVLALPQAVENLQRVRIDVAAGDRVLLARNDPRFDHRAALYQKRHER